MIDTLFTFKDYQNLLLARKALQELRKQQVFDQKYQNALQAETRLKAKLDEKGVTPELKEFVDAAVAVENAQNTMREKIAAYLKKYDGKPEVESGTEEIKSKPKIIT